MAISYPLVSIDVTSRCNLRCTHCRTPLDSFEPPGKQLLRYVEEICKLSPLIITLSGGEPLLRSDLFDVVSIIRSKKVAVQLNTSGVLVDDKIAQRIAQAGIEYVQVSIDGPEVVHDQIRGRGSFAKAVAACRRLGQITKLIINTTVNQLTLPHVEEMAECFLTPASGIVCYLLGLKRYIPFGRLGKKQALGPRGLRALLQLRETLSRRYPDIRIGSDVPQGNIFRMEAVLAAMERLHLGCAGCSAGVQCLTVRPDGAVSPCPTLYVYCGNLNDSSIDEIVEHPLLASLRVRAGLKGPCSRCSYKTVCGGCRAAAQAIVGDCLAGDPECFYARACGAESDLGIEKPTLRGGCP